MMACLNSCVTMIKAQWDLHAQQNEKYSIYDTMWRSKSITNEGIDCGLWKVAPVLIIEYQLVWQREAHF